MKTNRRIVIVVTAFVMMLAGTHAGLAQEKRPPIAGGYAQTSAYSQEVVSAARFAAREQRDLVFVESIKSAEVQVVAGRNYRINMRVWNSGKLKDVMTVVYKNLKGEYSLKSWAVTGSTDGGASGFPALYADSPVEQLMKAIAEAYDAKALGRLDASRPYLGRVRIEISDSITDRNTVRSFRTLAQAERWLRSREIPGGLPARETRPLYQCKGGTCEFDFNGGILHNHLYLNSVSYGWRRGRPYIKTIYLMDGD